MYFANVIVGVCLVVLTSNALEIADHQIDDSSSNDLKEYIKAVLEAHNRYRTMHGVPTLQLNEDVNENENLTSSVLEKFVRQILEAHNYFRILHGVPLLQLDEQLNIESQTWADELANTSTFHHSSSIHGENIYKEPIFFDRNGTTPVKFWYDEIEFYTFGKEPEDWYKVGHFTQLIWASTKYIGVGISENEDTRFIVCNYDPRGNIIRQTHYERLVPPLVTNNSTLKVTHNFSNDLVSTNNTSNFNSVIDDFLEMFNDFIRSKYGYTKNETVINTTNNNNTTKIKTENNTKLINFQAAINNPTIKTAILDRISVILNEISAD